MLSSMMNGRGRRIVQRSDTREVGERRKEDVRVDYQDSVPGHEMYRLATGFLLGMSARSPTRPQMPKTGVVLAWFPIRVCRQYRQVFGKIDAGNARGGEFVDKHGGERRRTRATCTRDAVSTSSRIIAWIAAVRVRYASAGLQLQRRAIMVGTVSALIND